MMNAEQAAALLEGLAFLGQAARDAEKQKAWLKEIKEEIAENKRQVKLVGAPKEIERNLADAERAKAGAESILDDAKQEAGRLVGDAEAGLVARDEALKARSLKLDEDTHDLRAKSDKASADLRQRQDTLTMAERAHGEKAEEMKKREAAVRRRENKIEERETLAKDAKIAAEDLAKRVTEAARLN